MKRLLFALLLLPTMALAEAGLEALPADTMITQWQSGHGYVKQSVTGTGADDTSVYMFGSQSFSIQTDGAASAAIWRKSSMSPTFDVSDKYMKIFVRIEDTSKLASLALNISSNNMTAWYYWNMHSDMSYFQSNEWIMMTLPFSRASVSGSPSRSAINAVQLYVKDKGAGAAKVWFGGLYSTPEPTEGIVTLDFDDGWATQYSVAAPKLAEYGYEGTAYLIPSLIGTAGYISLAEAQALKNTYGWDMGVHGVPTYTSYTSGDLRTYLESVKAYLTSNGLRTGNFMTSYPNGAYSLPVIDDVSATQIISARTIVDGDETMPPAHPYKLRQIHFNNTTPVATIIARIDAAMANKAWAIVTFHNIVTPADVGTKMTVADFDTIIDHIHTQGYTVKTMTEATDAYFNERQYVSSSGCTYNGNGVSAGCAASAGAAGAFNGWDNFEGQNRNLVAENKNLTVTFSGGCEAGGKTLDGWTMDATRALTIEGLCLNDVYGRSFSNNESYVTFRNIVIEKVGAFGYNVEMFNNTGTNVVVERSIFRQANMSRDGGYWVVRLAGGITFRNNFISGCADTCVTAVAETSSNVAIYNNTIDGSDDVGLEVTVDAGHATATIDIQNNLVTGSTTADYSINVGSASYTTATNISSDATSPQTGLRSKTITYVGGGDYHLDAGETDAIDAGTTIGTFSNDYDDDTRSGSWDIGADEIPAASGINLLLLHAEGY